MIKTRFAPSPTGYLHIGGARTALFSWAFAKSHHGEFFLRIEDSDRERSTQESVDSILSAMKWLGLDITQAPIFQSERLVRYTAMINQLLAQEDAYYCYCSKEELQLMREEQKSRGEKQRYDRRCLHREPVINKNPVVRFKNPQTGVVQWDDMIKGKIEIANDQLDDLIIARSDGSPTYNFCVVVDDCDMEITHVVRGDDHVNNTPRQINILKALGATIPFYAHAPMILRSDGQKMSKRTDAVSVMDYQSMGILPQALLNYLARLCWGHGNDEIFSIEQFLTWFNLNNISPSAARFDLKKLFWVNKEHIKMSDDQDLAQLIDHKLIKENIYLIDYSHLSLIKIIATIKARVDNLNSLYREVKLFFIAQFPDQAEINKIITVQAKSIIIYFADQLKNLINWELDEIKNFIKQFCIDNDLKMAELGMPLRLKLFGTTVAPSCDVIIYLLGKKETLMRLLKV